MIFRYSGSFFMGVHSATPQSVNILQKKYLGFSGKHPTSGRFAVARNLIEDRPSEGDERGREASGDEDEERDDAEDEEPIAPGGAPRLGAGIALEQRGVHRVAAKPDGEDGPGDGDRADQRVDGDVHPHAREHDLRDFELRRDDEDEGAGETGEQIADAGNQIHERIEADADIGARDREALVEQIGEEAREADGALPIGGR
jgi:hypothetical protein